MGIPKFYRWLSERYPLLNQPLTATEAPPQFDNLYLDMNGIIHNCTHGNDPNMKLTEEEMILRIYAYLDKLIQIIKPQNLVFMAIDGVAPRAKMNQQRSRRFKTGMERLKAKADEDAKAIREGRPVDTTEAFDSNCITPGTGFMARLGEHLRFFVRKKIADDVTWQKPQVVFSGHDVPGEGEHKIMEYIRLQQRSGEMAPNTRHVMYGLDADLIMLSLVTHQPHFCLLREVVSYTGRNRGQPTREALENPSAEHFVLFQIGLLREYLEMEFTALRLPFGLDVERIIDDFVLFCMLVGNDFLPALPTLDISEGALNKLIDIYKDLLPRMGGYLTHAGALDRGRLEQLLAALAALELKTLQDRADDAEYFERKRGRRGGGPPGNGVPTPGPPAAANGARGGEVALEALEPEEGEAAAVQQGPTMMTAEARSLIQGADGIDLWKDRYYAEKLEVKGAAARRGVVDEYVRGLHWVLEYYYRGVASWNWYYPYHYAPMASDLVALDSIQVVFSQGKPFRPFEQLLSVLPASSAKHLPQPFRWLMTDAASPILDFYPTDFPVDMEGKRADWEGVARICFVDEERLLKAASSVRADQLTAEERQRNQPGPILVFTSSRTPTNETEFCTATLPHKFASVLHCNSRCRKLPPPPPLPAGQDGFTPTLQPGTTTGLGAPAGFPTLKTMSVTGGMRTAGVNVFGQPSKKDSFIVVLKDLRSALGQPPPARSVAGSVVGERCYVNWPYLKEATVVAVSDPRERVTAGGPAAHSPEAAKEWSSSAAAIANAFLTKQGIDVGKCDLLLHVKDCIGYVRHVDDTIEKKFAPAESIYPLQAVLHRHPAHAALPPGEAPGEPTVHLEEGARVVFLGRTHYGCVGTLLPDPGAGLAKDGHRVPAMRAGQRWRVQLALPHPAAAELGSVARRALRGSTVRYSPSGEVARKLGVSSRALGRITSNLWISDGDQRWDVGLAVKHAAQELCVPGYAVPAPGGAGWHYSPALAKVVAAYRAAHPWVLAMLDSGQDAGTYRLEAALPDLAPEDRKAKVEAVQRWLKAQPLAKLRLVKADAKVAAEDAVRVLVANLPPAATSPATVDMENVPPVLLLPPAHAGTPQSALVGKDIDLGDRVVCVKPAGGPPFGSRGTVIAVYEDSAEVLMDEPFPGGTDLQGRLGGCRNGAHLSLHHLLPIGFPAAITVPRGAAPREVRAAPARPAPAAPQQQAEAPVKALPAVAEALALARKAAPGAAAGPSRPAGNAPPAAAASSSTPSGNQQGANALLGLLQRAAIKQQASGAPPPPRPAGAPPAPQPIPRGPPVPDSAARAPAAPGTPPGLSSVARQQPPAAAPRPAGPAPPGMPPLPGAGPSGLPPPAAAGPSNGPNAQQQAAPPVPKFLLERAQQRQAAKGHFPRMPDGTRGFGVGRGRPASPSQQPPPAAPGAIALPSGPPAPSATTPPASPGNAAGMALLAALQNGAFGKPTAPAQQQPLQQKQQPAAAQAKGPPPGINPGQLLLNQLQRGPPAPAAAAAGPGPTPRQLPTPSPPTSPYTHQQPQQQLPLTPPPGMPPAPAHPPHAGAAAGRQLLATLMASQQAPQQQPPPQPQQPPPGALDEQAVLLQLLRAPSAGSRHAAPSTGQPQRPPPEPYRPGNMGPPPGYQQQPPAAPPAAPPGINPGALLLSRLQKPGGGL